MMTAEQLQEKTERARAVLPALLDEKTRRRALDLIGQALLLNKEEILSANERDLEGAKRQGLPSAMCDRLLLTDERLFSIVEGIKQVALLSDPLGVEKSYTLENGLLIQKHRVPLGVIAMIYEARPNVTVDAAVLTLKSGNAVIL